MPKSLGLQASNFIKTRLRCRWFPVNFTNLFKRAFKENLQVTTWCCETLNVKDKLRPRKFDLLFCAIRFICYPMMCGLNLFPKKKLDALSIFLRSLIFSSFYIFTEVIKAKKEIKAKNRTGGNANDGGYMQIYKYIFHIF